MDKELKDLQNQFNQIPTSFTNNDKKRVREKIEKLQSKERRKGFHIYPKFLTGTVLAVAVLLIAVTVNQSPNLFMSSNDSGGFETNKVAQEFSIQNDASFDMETSNNDAAGVEESLGLNIFNPDTVQDEMNLPVIHVQQNGDEKIITFKGDSLTGRFIDEKPLMFSPDADTWNRIPIAEGDVNKDIPIYFADEAYTRSILDIEQGTANDITITPYALEYHFSPKGSSINLIMEKYPRISGRVTNSYDETIALSDELIQIYEEYKTSFDDNLLKGLSPFDVFRLYHYANYLVDLDTEYALYFKGDSFPYPDKESFIAEIEDAQAQTNYTVIQAEEFYEEMLQIQQFDEIKLSDNEVLIRYTTTHEKERHDIGFRLYLNEELDVYKVSWMPIQ